MPKTPARAMPKEDAAEPADAKGIAVAAGPAPAASPVPEHVVEAHYVTPALCPKCNGCQSVDSVKGKPWNRPRLVVELPGVRTGAVYPVECPDCRVPVPERKKK